MKIVKISTDKYNTKCLSLGCDVQVQITGLRREFSDISMKALRWLKRNYSDAQEASYWINEILSGTQEEPPVTEGVSNFGELGDQLQKKWRFANPGVLEQLVEETQDATLIQQMREYGERFKHFCSSFPITQKPKYSEVFFEEYDPSQPCLVLIIESDTNFYAVEVFLAEVFDIYKRYLRVHKVVLGEVKKVTLQYPPSIEPLLEERIRHTCNSNKHADIHVKLQTEAQEKQHAPSNVALSKDSRNEEGLSTEANIDTIKMHQTMETSTESEQKMIFSCNKCNATHQEQPYKNAQSQRPVATKRSYSTGTGYETSKMHQERARTRLRKRAHTTGATEEDLKHKKVKEICVQ